MRRFVLATLGSLGDLHPYLALGLGLKSRGHQVAIATSRYYESTVVGLGLEFRPVRPDLAEQMNLSAEVSHKAHRMQDGTEYVLKQMVLPYLEQTYLDLLAAFGDADVVVNHAVLFATPLAAEKLGIPWISAILSPGIFLSAYDPPILPPMAWFNSLRRLGPMPHRLLHTLIDRITHRWMRPVHELREREGLPPTRVNPVTAGMLSPHGTLAMFSSLLGCSQPDWPEGVEITGFTFFGDEQAAEPDPALRRFLSAGDPPVVFTLGSDAVTDAGQFYEESLKAVGELGCRAVFLTGHDPRNRPKGPVPDTVFFHPYAHYPTLFPHARVVVHSGGVGTIAHAFRAGVPMLVVPFAADQPDNGARIERQGYGRCLWRDRYHAQQAVPLIRELLEDPRYRSRLQEAQRQVVAEDGVARACSFLERVALGERLQHAHQLRD